MEPAKSSISYPKKVSLQTEELSKLVCPVCYEYMKPPIMQCETGHGICELCHELLSECPTCQSELIHRRSSDLELLTSLVLFPCKRCGMKYSLHDLNQHKCGDSEVNISCLIGQVYGDCSWIGKKENILEHCRTQHPKNFWTQNENFTTWGYCDLSNIGIQNVFILDLIKSLFIIVQKYDSNLQSLIWNISCQCDKKEIFAYEIILISANEICDKKFTRVIANEENIVSFFPSGNEIIIPVQKVTEFLCDKVLQYKVVIHRKNDIEKEEDRHIESICDGKIILSERGVSFTDNSKQTCTQKAWNSVMSVYHCVKNFVTCSQ